MQETKVKGFEEFLSCMKKATEEVKAADDMAWFYDMHHQEPPSLAMGDMVWLDATNITTNCSKKKLDNKWLGPYPIAKVVLYNTYKLKLPLSFGRVHPVFNVSLLCPHTANEIPEHPAPHPPLGWARRV
jgi:hypothetical protein